MFSGNKECKWAYIFDHLLSAYLLSELYCINSFLLIIQCSSSFGKSVIHPYSTFLVLQHPHHCLYYHQCCVTVTGSFGEVLGTFKIGYNACTTKIITILVIIAMKLITCYRSWFEKKKSDTLYVTLISGTVSPQLCIFIPHPKNSLGKHSLTASQHRQQIQDLQQLHLHNILAALLRWVHQNCKRPFKSGPWIFSSSEKHCSEE